MFGHSRQRIAMLHMPGSSNRQWMPIDGQSGTGGRRLHDLDALGHDFAADIVAQQNPELHDHSPRNSSPTAYVVQNNCSSHQWPPAIVSSAKVEYPAPTKAMWDFYGATSRCVEVAESTANGRVEKKGDRFTL